MASRKRKMAWRQYCVCILNTAKCFDILPKPTVFRCVDCGKRATCWEHRDYGKPLDVEPTCHRCNLRRGPAKYPNRMPWAFACFWRGWKNYPIFKRAPGLEFARMRASKRNGS
jgi:hypothetical protein